MANFLCAFPQGDVATPDIAMIRVNCLYAPPGLLSLAEFAEQFAGLPTVTDVFFAACYRMRLLTLAQN